ncbi:MAG: hypothetical protein K2Y22_09350 [Candidatus Obscuribacterales bacterium]|nr:hypothetical protein [Candidatus Obscuribacterales bacterium]
MSGLDTIESNDKQAGATVDASRFTDYIASNDVGSAGYRQMSGAKYDSAKPVGGQVMVPKMDESIYPKAQEKPKLLQGHASVVDPDAGNEDVMIGWNKWAKDVQLQSKKNLNEFLTHPSKLTINDEAVTQADMLEGIDQQNRFAVKFDRNGHVAQIKKMQSSGNKIFDKISETAITDLDGTDTVDFPTGSHRQVSDVLEFGFRPGAGRDDLRQMSAERVTRPRNYYDSDN